MNWETRRDKIAMHAWETWTKNGLGLDDWDREQTAKTVNDKVSNAYQDGMTDSEWLTATLKLLP